jgi:hypothetical protein
MGKQALNPLKNITGNFFFDFQMSLNKLFFHIGSVRKLLLKFIFLIDLDI